MPFVRPLKPLLLALFVATLAGCAGAGGCTGVSPLPNGFDRERRVQNAASFRLTEPGLTFLEQNIGAIVSGVMGSSDGIFAYPVPSSNGDLTLVTYEICPEGPVPDAVPPSCTAEVALAAAHLELAPEAPHELHVYGTLPVRIQSLPVLLHWPLGIDGETIVTVNGNDVCPPSEQDFAEVGIDVVISVAIDDNTDHARYGYSRIRVESIAVNQDDVDAALQFCGGSLQEAILTALKGVILPMIVDSLVGTVKTKIDELLCQKASIDYVPACPTGTYDVEGVCRYGTAPESDCVATVVGIDGRADLSKLYASLGTGNDGFFELLFAVGGHDERSDGSGFHWGDLNPIGGGATLAAYGGVEPRPGSTCVTPAYLPMPEDVPIPVELTENAIAGWPSDFPDVHVGIALSERFANFALGQLYDAGALCVTVTGDQIPMLNSRLISLGVGAPSMAELGHMRNSQPLSVMVRPSQPPHVTFGNGTSLTTDPLVHLTLEQLSFDFYVWSLDRYVRALTATADVDLPLNLEATPEGLVPVLDALSISNMVVTNSGLVREEPAKIVSALESLVGDTVGSMLAGAATPIDLASGLGSFGLGLRIPPTVAGQGSPGLRRLESGSDVFLGVFGSFVTASAERELRSLPPDPEAPTAGAGGDPASLAAEDPSGSCVCSLPKLGARTHHWAFGLLPIGAALARARRRRPRGRRPRLALLGVGLLALLPAVSGCSCNDETGTTSCAQRGDCVALKPGLIGAYASAAVGLDGTLWISGYLEADWTAEHPWGDLVVGRYDGSAVQWEVVDGVPADAVCDEQIHDPNGFRHGIVEPGDDVGLWTSLAIDAQGNPAVAYYDATARALRYAYRQGESWTTTLVDRRDFADIGRYAKLLFVGAQPVISYLFIEPGAAPVVESGVRVATGSSAVPAEGTWSFETAYLEPATPCRTAFCSDGFRCVQETGLCTPARTDCEAPCLSTEGCVEGDAGAACQGIYTAASLESYPTAAGLYVAAAPHPGGGVGLAFYDRIHGNVVVSSKQGGTWSAVIAAGEEDGVDTGDVGVGLSLAIDGAANFHLAYADARSHALHYQAVGGGTTPYSHELVDDGTGLGGAAFGDGRHVVGDDSSITVSGAGEVRITYQDATAGTLRHALGIPTGGVHQWTLTIVSQQGFAGAFSRQLDWGGSRQVINWWREAAPRPVGEVRVLPLP